MARRAAAPVDGGGCTGGEGRGGGQSTEERVAETVQAVVEENVALEGKVGRLRVWLAQERARALDRRREAGTVAEEIRRSECERARYAEKLRRHGKRLPAVEAGAVEEDKCGTADGQRLRGAIGGHQRVVPEVGATAGAGEGEEDDAAEGMLLERYLGVGLSELTEREGELFGRLQADTLEMRQRARAAEKAEEEVRAEGARRAATMNAALEAALSEGTRFKEEAGACEVC